MFLALTLGATFVARSFSGDKAQLVPILKAALQHRGFALVDVISPCVAFNDHEGSTKSYMYTREHAQPLVEAEFVQMNGAHDFVPPADEITAAYAPGSVSSVTLHDGSTVRFRKIPESYDPTDRDAVYSYLREREHSGEVVTGLLYLDPSSADMHATMQTVERPLTEIPFEELCPGRAALDEIQQGFI